MRIAILGATSQIAKDLIISFSENSNHDLILFARRPDLVIHWLTTIKLNEKYSTHDFGSFGVDKYFDAIINFVGVGDPAKAVNMGASIFDVTQKYDEMALDYVRQQPNCKYIFLSSGAAYNSTFDEPVDRDTKAVVAINNLQPNDWYALAKLSAECRHRSLSRLSIVDIRVFNYFSHTQDLNARFLIMDILRAIQLSKKFITSPENIVRDYIGSQEFYNIVSSILYSDGKNTAIDCYSKQPIDKMSLLQMMKNNFSLDYDIKQAGSLINATGNKINYFSRNYAAEEFGYIPKRKSVDIIKQEMSKIIQIMGVYPSKDHEKN